MTAQPKQHYDDTDAAPNTLYESLMKGLPWFGFWVFMSIVVWVEYDLHVRGHETPFFTHKTPEELRIREATIQKLESEAARAARKAKQ